MRELLEGERVLLAALTAQLSLEDPRGRNGGHTHAVAHKENDVARALGLTRRPATRLVERDSTLLFPPCGVDIRRSGWQRGFGQYETCCQQAGGNTYDGFHDGYLGCSMTAGIQPPQHDT